MTDNANEITVSTPHPRPPDYPVPEPPPPPTEGSEITLDPNTAAVASEDLTMHVHGTGFTDASRISFNGGYEETVFVSDTELTTIVKPSTASGTHTVPVWVVNVYSSTATADFTFTEAQP